MKKIFFFAALITFSAKAQEAKVDSLKEEKVDETKQGFSFNGYLDVNYFYNSNKPLNDLNTGASGFARAFDQKANQFQIGLVQTKITYAHKKTDAVVDLVFGPHADLGNYGNVIGPLGSTTSLAIKQAYFNWKATSKFTFTAGQFGTHVGYEVIDAPLNYHYSLNNLFNNGPFYHIGAKATYAFNDKFALMGGIVNNWDNLYENNIYKTAIGQLAFTPSDKVHLYVNYVGGDESTITDGSGNTLYKADSLKGFKQLIDVVGTFAITEKLNVGINAVMGQLGYTISDKRTTSNWGGAALYVNYSFTDKFSLGGRFDYLDNTQGVQYIGNNSVMSGTLTGVIKVDEEHLLIKPEVRLDQFNHEQFMDHSGFYTKKTQATFGIALIYKY